MEVGLGQRGSCALSRGPLPRAHGHGARLSVRAHDLQGVLHATSSLETDARMGDFSGTVIIGGHPLQCRQRAAPVHRQHRVKVTALCGHCDGYAQVGRACDDGKLQCRLHNNRNDKLSGTAVQRCSGALEHTVHWKCAPPPSTTTTTTATTTTTTATTTTTNTRIPCLQWMCGTKAGDLQQNPNSTDLEPHTAVLRS